MKSSEGVHPRKWEFIIPQDVKSPFEVVHDRNLIHVIFLLAFFNQVKVSMKADAHRRSWEFKGGCLCFTCTKKDSWMVFIRRSSKESLAHAKY